MDNTNLPKTPSEVLSVKDFTARFGSRSFLYDLIDKGELRFHYLGHKPFLYLSEILAAMKDKPVK